MKVCCGFDQAGQSCRRLLNFISKSTIKILCSFTYRKILLDHEELYWKTDKNAHFFRLRNWNKIESNDTVAIKASGFLSLNTFPIILINK